jgi:hypothetical protein
LGHCAFAFDPPREAADPNFLEDKSGVIQICSNPTGAFFLDARQLKDRRHNALDPPAEVKDRTRSNEKAYERSTLNREADEREEAQNGEHLEFGSLVG